MQYFLALDAGGTKTIGAIGDGERELARAEGGTIKLLRTDPERARMALAELFSQLAGSAQIDLKRITRICIGASGVRVPKVTNWIRTTVPLFAAGELLLCGDEEIALDAAFHGGAGVMVIAGTGSMAVGRARNGKLAHVGGWGPALGDEGAAHWIGQEALRSALRARDEGLPSHLAEAVVHHWRLAGLKELVEEANATPAPDFARLAPVVVSASEAGDPVALEIVHRAGEELARLALLVVQRLRKLGERSTLSVGFTGSVISNGGRVRAAMIDALRRANAEIRILLEPADPIEGALWRARNSVGPT